MVKIALKFLVVNCQAATQDGGASSSCGRSVIIYVRRKQERILAPGEGSDPGVEPSGQAIVKEN
jgi:hypothetical protein